MNRLELTKILLKEMNGLDESERDRFSEIANKLLQVNYFVNKDKYLDDYLFAFKFRELFSSYFSLSDYKFGIDEKYQLVYLQNLSSFNKLSLKKLESVILLALRILYFRKNEKVSLSNNVEVNLTDLHVELSRIGYTSDDERVKKSELYPILRMYRNYNIIDYISKDFDDESRIAIYPSIIYAVDIGSIKDAIDMFKAYGVGESEDEEINED